MNLNELVPKDKFDISFYKKLKSFQIKEIRSVVPMLLVALQDGNWPIAGPMMDYFGPKLNEVADEICTILHGDDSI